MPCSAPRFVFRCFRTLERWGDAVTGAAGPLFVTLAVLLITVGVISFFDVLQPELAWPWLTTPICLLILLNLIAHYYYVCTVSPGFVHDQPQTEGHGLLWARKRGSARALTGGVQWTDDNISVTKAGITQCRKCMQPRPERAHHCRVCKRCVLKYDHHCPWVNQCVGLHNERHFVLFMAWLVVAAMCFSYLGFPRMYDAVGYSYTPWRYRVPETAFMLIYVLALVLGLAVAVMCGWHLWSVARGETSVEASDHEIYRRFAKERQEDFVNSYDLGKLKNLQLFFNVGPSGYPAYTLFIPLRTMPYTDGRHWARRKGIERHGGVREGDELTDDEDGQA